MLNTSCTGTIRSKVQFKCTVLVGKAQKKYHPDMKTLFKNCQFYLFYLEKIKSIVSEKPKTEFLTIE